MGGGDVKLAAFLGAILGFPYIITGLLAGFIVGGVAGIALWLMGKRGRRDMVPYGPALAAGAVIHLLAGPGFYHWYLGLVR
jgi:leader peptidase (prepilin peptidase)/N-methyltransferase